MKLIKSISEMQTLSRQYKGTAGFVPTMGYLHDGHLSLVRKACTDCDEVVVSIYVNPSQFGHGEDFQQYPRSLQQDMELLSSLDVKYLFVPQDEEMYRADYKTWVSVEGLTGVLCGKSRPAHFRGVTTIVTKLLHIINPDIIFLGEKDFQQLVVIRQMVRDLNISVEVVGCPLIREKDGLAMSSRNKYLSRLGREKSLCLYRSLLKAQEMYHQHITSSREIISQMETVIKSAGGKIDYIDIIDPDSLLSVPQARNRDRAVLAVYIDNTRLIDNMEFTE